MFLEIQPRASGVSQRSKALHRSARDSGSILGCVAADRETHERVHNWPHVVRVRGGFGRLGCPYPIPLRSSNSLWRPGACTLTSGRQLYSVSSDTKVRLASGLSEQCVKKQCGLAGCVSKDAWLSTFTSPVWVRMEDAAMGQDCN